MHITVEPKDDHAALYLRGEFDTYYVPVLQQEIEALAKTGIHRIVLDLRLVKFINSTALGAIIKASKGATERGGKLVISRPSPFCRDILEKVGLDRVVPIVESEEAARAALFENQSASTKPAEKLEESESTVIFSPVDEARIEHFLGQSKRLVKAPLSKDKPGSAWSGLGRMAALDPNGLRFNWSGGNTELSPFAMAQLLAIGTEWRVKFRMPMYKRGYCEAVCAVREVEERSDGVKVGASFSDIDAGTRDAIRQYASDMAYLKDELRRATDK